MHTCVRIRGAKNASVLENILEVLNECSKTCFMYKSTLRNLTLSEPIILTFRILCRR